MCTDSSAAVGVAELRGFRKIRHLEAWVFVDTGRNQNWQDRHIYPPIWGDLNPSDILTKGVVLEDLERRLGAMHMYVCSGRASELRSAVIVEQAVGGLYPAPAVWAGWLYWNGMRGNCGMSRQSWRSASGTEERCE